MPHITLSNGCDMYYELHGDPGDRTLLLIHGLAATSILWKHHVQPLVDAGWRVLLADWPGNGESGPVECEFSLEMLSSSFMELADTLGVWEQPMVVCGHSAGGALAQMIYLAAPERVAGLVLLHSGFRFMDLRLLPFINAAMPAYTSVVFHPAVVGTAQAGVDLARSVAGTFLDEDHPVMLMLRIGLTSSEADVMIRQMRAFANMDIEGQLADIRVPTLIVSSRFDHIVPTNHARAMHDGIPGSELCVTNRIGHNAHVHYADETSAIIRDFLARNF